LCGRPSPTPTRRPSVALRAHEGVEVGRQPAQLTPRHELPHPVDGKGDVEVAHDRRAVEAETGVALDDVDCRGGRGDHAIRLVARPEQPVPSPVQPGCGDDRQPAFGERLRRRHEGRSVVDLGGERQEVVAVDLGQPVESGHWRVSSQAGRVACRVADLAFTDEVRNRPGRSAARPFTGSRSGTTLRTPRMGTGRAYPATMSHLVPATRRA
jgi:hypothetical protein